MTYNRLNDFEPRPTPAQATRCEAETRNKQALYVLENEWGSGRIDVSALKRILLGGEPDNCAAVSG